MDTVTLVENQIDDGQRLLDKLKEDGFIVRAACWVKPVEEDRWSLFIATPAVDENGSLAAYGHLVRVLRPLGEVSISTSDVSLIGEKHPLVQDWLLEILRRFPHSKPTRPPRPLLGRIPVEEVYVYPLGKVEVTVYGLIYEGEPGGALHLSLEPHNPQSTLEVESKGNCNKYHAKTGRDWVVAAPEGARIERSNIGLMELVWQLHGNETRSSANEVWSLAKLELHGFRFLREPDLNGTNHSN